MGTLVTVVLPDPTRPRPRAVEDLFATWEAALSRFRPDSELSLLNASAGRPFVVSPLLAAVVEEALRAARATDGLFDPSMEPALRASATTARSRRWTATGPVAAAGIGAGGSWRGIEVDHAARHGPPAGRRRARPRWHRQGHGRRRGNHEAGAPWASRPRSSRPAATWPSPGCRRGDRLAGGGRSVRGSARRRDHVRRPRHVRDRLARAWTRGGVEQHHLVDPRTGGRPRNDLWSVTAAASSCARAEVAAKVAFVLGRPRRRASSRASASPASSSTAMGARRSSALGGPHGPPRQSRIPYGP